MSEVQRSSRRNPCPCCGRVKDGDCRVTADGLVLCHRNTDHRPGAVIRGQDGSFWAFTGVTADQRCGVFKPDEPLPAREVARVIPPPASRQTGLWAYSSTQQVVRSDHSKGKSFCPWHQAGGQWVKGAGPDPWPFYGAPSPGIICETEGEKCCDVMLQLGIACISHPGHDLAKPKMAARYAGLLDIGVEHVLYIADNDKAGRDRADKAQEAAKAAGVTLSIFHAADLFPGIKQTGSVDDVDPELIKPALAKALAEQVPTSAEGYFPDKAGAEYAALLREERSGRDLAEAAAKIADQYKVTASDWYQIKQQADREYESELQKKAEVVEIRQSLASQKARAEFKLELMLPAPIATALATVTQTLPTDDLCTTMAFLAAASGTFKIGTTLCANVLSNYKVPLNLFVVLVAPSGKKKSPVLRAACRDPWEWVRADAAAANRQAREDWEAACEGVSRNERPDRPMPVFPFITGATGEALSQQFAVHEDDPRRMGILLFKDELSSFFTGLDAYRSGSKKCDQASILEAFEGTGCTELRATKESRMFERCHLSILGGIQPAIFEQQVAHKGDPDGFFARFLYARLPQVSKRMPLHASAEQVAELHRQEDYLKGIMLRLYKLPPTKLILCDKAMELFVELDYEAQELGGMAASDTAEGPVYGKRCANVARVAGVLHMLRIAAGVVADDDFTVDVDTYLMARDIVLHLQQYAITQQRRIASNASPDAIDNTLRLVHRIAQALAKPVSPGEVRQRLNASQRKTLSSQDIQVAFRELESIGFGSICPGPRSAPQFLASGQLPVL